MKTYKYSRIGNKLYYNELNNGFRICVIPNLEKNNFYAVIGVKYGSSDTSFKDNGRVIETNYGIAHFLEHMTFNMEDGEEPFSFLNKSGVNSNASTTFDTTRYYIWGSEDFKKNLDYLLTFVFSPYFNEEGIKRERGIINEEIRMYKDEPGWHLDDEGRKMIFSENPCKEPISGTHESIAKITEQELYDCYNAFYVPNNMFLVVSGNITNEEVMDVIKNNKLVNEAKPNYNVERLKFNEPDEVIEEFKKIEMNIYLSKLKYAFKMRRDNFSIKDDIKLNMYLNMLLSILFETSSEFNEKITSNNIASSYYVDCILYGKHYLVDFVAESEKADIFKDEVDKVLANIQIDEDDFRRIKRVWIASEFKMSDSNDMLAENIMDDYIRYGNFHTDRIDIIESLSLKELKKVISELNWNNSCFILATPKETN